MCIENVFYEIMSFTLNVRYYCALCFHISQGLGNDTALALSRLDNKRLEMTKKVSWLDDIRVLRQLLLNCTGGSTETTPVQKKRWMDAIMVAFNLNVCVTDLLIDFMVLLAVLLLLY